MKRSLATIAVLALCAMPAISQAQTTVYPTPAAPGAPVIGTTARGPHGERHPEMRKALKQLENAKLTLRSAAHDYSGHRDQAIQLIDQAEAQIHQGLETVGQR